MSDAPTDTRDMLEWRDDVTAALSRIEEMLKQLMDMSVQDADALECIEGLLPPRQAG